MAKRIPLNGEWTLTGFDPANREDVSLPLRLPDRILPSLRRSGLVWGDARSSEWIYLRSWRFSRLLQRPAEPPEGESERFHLYLGALCGTGRLCADGQELQPLSPYAQIDLSSFLAKGSCLLELRFDPALMAGESAMPALFDPPVLVTSYFSRILRAGCRGGADGRLHVSLEIQGYGKGRVQLKYRLLKGDLLCASLNSETRLQACVQQLRETLELKDPVLWPGDNALYTLLVTVERGGIRCDSLELPACFFRTDQVSPPLLLGHFLEGADPKGTRALGFTCALLERLPSQKELLELDHEGLSAWLLMPPDRPVSGTALLRGLVPHGCAAFLGLSNCFFADGSPADSRDARLFAIEQTAAELGLSPFSVCDLPFVPLPEKGGFLRAVFLYHALTRLRRQSEQSALSIENGLLFDADGLPTQEAAAIAAAMAPVSLHIVRPSLLYPGMELRLSLYPLGNVQGFLLLEAQLYTHLGQCLRTTAFPLISHHDPNAPFVFEARLPSPLTGPLLLRLRLKNGEETLWSWDEPIFSGEPSLSVLPGARILLARSGNAWYAVNKGSAAAMGLVAHPQTQLLTLLPGESLRAEHITGGERNTWICMEEEDVSC